ncbi:class II aldolase/adducin N-terminal [Naematelia encephala]|uniref:Class II aldolase/adducin N-terminal n=1 Tax=Naematelia encephala TaxID=71784 RepID=A0A1Y2AFJ7_9TREE|nr:class II aldolase/adducin N-terminal [Naematelia encephala]
MSSTTVLAAASTSTTNRPSTDAVFHQSTDKLSKNPLERTWRGNKEGTLKIEAYPAFHDATDEEGLLKKRQWIKEHLAIAFRFWGKMGYGEGISGHITVRDPILTDHFWMNPFGVHFSHMSVSKLVLVTPDGYVHPLGAQRPINMAGFYIHSAIHHARPEVQAAGHCHSLHGKTWSAFGLPVDITTQDSCLFYDNQAVYRNFGGIVLAAEEGANIAQALGPKNKCCILQNHGLLTLGHTVDECAYLFSALDKQCRAQLMIEAAVGGGLKKTIISDEDAAFTAATIQ